MIRRLMASSAMLALMTAGALSVATAQTQQSTDTQQPPAAVTQPTDQGAATADQGADTSNATAAATDTTLTPDRPTIATAFIGRSVYSSENPDSDNIGDVNDLIIGDDGKITHAVVGVGGFLGIGEKNVAVPFDELQVVEDDNGDIRLIYAATKEQLEAAEPYDRTAYDPKARASENQQAAANANQPVDQSGATSTMAAAPAADMTAQPAPAPDTAASTDTAASSGASTDTMAAPATDQAATTADTNAAPADQQQVAAATDQTQTTAAQTDASQPATDQTQTDQQTASQTADQTATDQQQTAQTETTQAPVTTETQTNQQMAAGDTSFLSFGADQMRASDVMGKEVYGADNESIGEVGDLVLQEDGKTRAALVDVGGFLGVGEKEVAIPFDQIQVTKEGNEPRLTVAMTKDQLEQMPAYENPNATADQTGTAATGNMTAGNNAATTAPSQDVATTDQNAAGADQGFQTATQDLSADQLIGSKVYGPDDKDLGEVDDVVFDKGGGIQAVVIDVGGFLGIGEKPVAVQFDALNVQKDVNGDMRLMVNATEDQLKQAPSYDANAAQAQ